MAHGAGRLARKTASMMGAAAMQAAKRRRSEAEEDNAAVEAVHSGTAAVYNAARYRSPSSKTAANSKRAASLHKNTIRSEENVRSEFMKSSEHAAQAEHRKRNGFFLFKRKNASARLPKTSGKDQPSSPRAALPPRPTACLPRRKRPRKLRSPSFRSIRGRSWEYAWPG